MSLNRDNIPKIVIKDLIKDVLMDSSILAFIDFKDLMQVNPNFTYFDIMKRMIRLSLEKHEGKCPLIKRSKILIQENAYEFKDTFDAFLENKITEPYATLIPKVAPFNLDTSALHVRRSWYYKAPILEGVHNLGLIDADYLAPYPVRAYHDKDEDDFTKDSCIYYIAHEGGPTQDYLFKRQFYFQVLNYLKGVKNNLRYPDMPIELLQGIDEEWSNVQQELSESYRKVFSHGKLYR